MPVPEWLVPAFQRSAIAAGATASASTIDAAADRLIERWTEPDRRFHSIGHLIDLLQRVDELQQEAARPHLVRLAAWYHGAVFDAEERAAAKDSRLGENEAASAEYAREELTALGVDEKPVEQVVALVQGLERHSPSLRDLDAAVLSDADLAVLATEPQRYKVYTDQVRQEYAHVAPLEYLETRHRILKRLMARDSIYLSPLARGWERQARENVTAELSRLERDIAAASAA
ncbi:hypothetical protein ON058_09865 [Demequina sp. B12]|uniref:HD domain-containing protein n=1 Tax=Demequina sp. B12 TaxID=2992757 RepID=UPI00237AA8CA|nr:hypothetical protein [Demequina sp. B12]MDE0573719.1 hypothetical protein [Demequina sp. B12]